MEECGCKADTIDESNILKISVLKYSDSLEVPFVRADSFALRNRALFLSAIINALEYCVA